MAEGNPPNPTNPTTEVRRKISPYDLTSADNPGAVISNPLLKGTNYDEWACGMKTALCSRKKFGFLDGSIERPAEGSPDLEDWWTIQALLVSWIKMTIDPVLRSNISHRDVAKDLWDHLKKRFSVMNGPKLQQIKAELACCKQRGLAIESYYGKLTKIWDSMASFRPLRTCKCGKCECDLGSIQEKDREEDKVHQFLFGLDDTLFRTVRSSLISRVPVQPLEEVYNIVRQEEDLIRNGTKMLEEQPDVSAFAVQMRPRSNQFQGDKEKGVICKHCNRGGHASDSCYAVIGYPDWWGERPRSRSLQGRGRGGASSSGGRGRGASTYANRVLVPNLDTTEQANYVVTDQDREAVSGFTESQWRSLKNIINAGKEVGTEKLTGKSCSPSWIMDTGASHHLTGKYEILTNVRDMDPVLIVLADGRERVSVKEGSVRLGSDLEMKYVFYVEEFQSDLISIGQLMDENHCVLQMADHFLVVQDRTTRTLIGAGTRVGGTFHFRSTEIAASVTTKEEKKYELWHNRMGHPAAKVVGLLPEISVSVSSTNLNKADVVFSESEFPFSSPVSMESVNVEEEENRLWAPISQGPLEEEVACNLGPQSSGPLNINLNEAQSEERPSNNGVTVPTIVQQSNAGTSENRPDSSTIDPVPSTKTATAPPTKPTKRTRSVRAQKAPAPVEPPETRQSKRKREAPVTLRDFVVNSAACVKNDSSSAKVQYPISKQDSKIRFSASHTAYMTTIATAKEPKSYKAAIKDERWRNAMVGLRVICFSRKISNSSTIYALINLFP
ncbi:unnamed protein product [Arabidopsis halleri]